MLKGSILLYGEVGNVIELHEAETMVIAVKLMNRAYNPPRQVLQMMELLNVTDNERYILWLEALSTPKAINRSNNNNTKVI